MSKFIDAIKAGVDVAAEDMRPGRFVAGERPMRCPYCGEEEFVRHALMLSQGIEMAIACTTCGTKIRPPVDPERTGPAR